MRAIFAACPAQSPGGTQVSLFWGWRQALAPCRSRLGWPPPCRQFFPMPSSSSRDVAATHKIGRICCGMCVYIYICGLCIVGRPRSCVLERWGASREVGGERAERKPHHHSKDLYSPHCKVHRALLHTPGWNQALACYNCPEKASPGERGLSR